MNLSSRERRDTPSLLVSSDQADVHPDLVARVRKHADSVFQKPPHAETVQAFERAATWRAQAPERPLVLDTGCGTGASSRTLARAMPEALVIGIDKSADRLKRGTSDNEPENLLLLRANLLDFYPLARRAGWRCAAQYALYPNPWPKAAQLNKRWHGSPVFPDLVALGGTFELRCNWQTYAKEMRMALAVFGIPSVLEAFVPDTPMTLFEAKYAASGHSLWRLRATLDPVA